MIATADPRPTLRRRLLLVGSLTALLVGLVTWYTESERIDERVLSLALAAAHRISPEMLEPSGQAETGADALQRMVELVAADHFGIVELYDRNRQRLIEYVPPALVALEEELKQGGHVELAPQPRYMKRLVQGKFALVVAVPIFSSAGEVAGYLEGVYLPSPETMAQIREDVLRTVAMVVLAILLTTLSVYPVVLALHREVLARSQAILKGNLELLEVLGSAIAQRDSDTNVHNYRVTLYAVALGEAAGQSAADMRCLIAGAFLRDIGKIGISDSILLKPDRLTADEFEVMKTHVSLGKTSCANPPGCSRPGMWWRTTTRNTTVPATWAVWPGTPFPVTPASSPWSMCSTPSPRAAPTRPPCPPRLPWKSCTRVAPAISIQRFWTCSSPWPPACTPATARLTKPSYGTPCSHCWIAISLPWASTEQFALPACADPPAAMHLICPITVQQTA